MERKNNNGIIYVAISLAIVALLVTGITVSAGSTWKQQLMTEVAKIIAPQIVSDINAEVPTADAEGEQLGAVPGQTLQGDYLNFNSLETWVKTGTFRDATTSLACIKNPANATSTVDLGKILITGAPTSTVAINVATTTSANSYSTSTVAGTFMSVNIPSGSTGVAYSGNNSKLVGVYAAGTAERIVVGVSEYICFVGGDGLGTSKGFTDDGNSFAGNYVLRFVK